MARAEAIGLRYNVADPDRRLQLLAGQGDLDRDLPLRGDGIDAGGSNVSGLAELRRALRGDAVGVADAIGALALAFAPRRGERGVPRATCCGSPPASALLIIALMYWLDAAEIRLDAAARHAEPVAAAHPHRFRQVGLCAVGAVCALLFARAGRLRRRKRGTARSLLLGLGTRLQFLFLAVLVPVLAGELLKWAVGRGRPFVGGEANAFHFSHFAGSEAYASFPSGHATTAFALAFAVSALWPQTRM